MRHAAFHPYRSFRLSDIPFKRLILSALIVALLVLSGGLAQAMTRDVVRFGSDFMVDEGMSVRDVVVIMGDITVDGPVDRDVIVIGGSVVLTNKATVGRNVIAISGTVDQSDDAEVDGEVSEINIPGLYALISLFSGDQGTGPFLWFAVWPLICFASFLVLAMLVTALFPESTRHIADRIALHPVKSGFTGIIALLMIVPVGILLAISIIGLVLIPVEMTVVSAALLIGYVAAAKLVGARLVALLKRPPTTQLWETFWGIIALGLIGLIPVAGWLLNALVLVIGFGGAWLALLKTRHPAVPAREVPEPVAPPEP